MLKENRHDHFVSENHVLSYQEEGNNVFQMGAFKQGGVTTFLGSQTLVGQCELETLLSLFLNM